MGWSTWKIILLSWSVVVLCRDTYYSTDISPERNSHLSEGLGSKCFLRNSEGEGNSSKSSFYILASSTSFAKQMEAQVTSRAEWFCSLSAVCASLIRCLSSGGQETEDCREAQISPWLKLSQWINMEKTNFKKMP